jgi:hypothetical protein
MIWPFDGIFGSSDPPAAAKPPTPATTPGASTAQPTQDCPLHSKHPCAINKLMIKVTGRDEEDKPPKILKLETTKVRRFDPVTDVKDSSALTLLKTCDLLIECLADTNAVTNAKAEPAEVEGRAYYTSPACETQSHALLTLTPLGTRDLVILKKIGAEEIEMPSHKLFAMTSYIDRKDKRDGVLDAPGTIFGIVKSLIESIFGFVTEADLRADACGKRAAGDGGHLNEMLLARVRVFRKTKWTIGIKIPPLGSFKAEKDKMTDVHGIKSTTNTMSGTAGFNAFSGSKTTTQDDAGGLLGNSSSTSQTQVLGFADSNASSRTVKDGSVTTTSSQNHSDYAGHTTTNTDGTITTKEIEERLETESGFDLVISIDDTEIEVGEGVKKIKELVKSITETITDIHKLFDAVPQVGWKFTFDVSVFAGTILCECAPEYVEGVKAGGRYYAVQHKFKGKIEIKLFSISIGVSFGLDAQALDSGLVLKIQGTLTLECKISKEINLDFFTPKQEFEVEAKSDVELAVVGYVSVLGKTLADGKLSVGGGLAFKGKFEAELPTRKFDLTGKLKSEDILLSGYIRCPCWWDKKIDPAVVLLKERPLYTLG